jgi:hypothetical protein
MLVQFKTYPMSDPGHFEISGLQIGRYVYQFSGQESVRLLSLICSDALQFMDQQAQQAYEKSLIIHIQLNPNPRHQEFRRYRDRLFRYPGDATEVICLNWAQDVRLWQNQTEAKWKNIAGSAWYLRPDKFDHCDETLTANHRKGLYYTWLHEFKFHVLFFNYKPAIFFVESSKVFHLNIPAVSSRRRGPQLRRVLVWDAAKRSWVDEPASDDGFLAVLPEAGAAAAQLQAGLASSPFAVERILALGAGKAGPGVEWHAPSQLDSCSIADDEVIKRITFCQDRSDSAADFRIGRLRRCRELVGILKTAKMPPAIADFAQGFDLVWSPQYPHQNARSSAGHATVIYMGEGSSRSAIEAAFAHAADNLHRGSRDADQSIADKQRLAVWYREDGKIHLYEEYSLAMIDKSASASPVDIGRQ